MLRNFIEHSFDELIQNSIRNCNFQLYKTFALQKKYKEDYMEDRNLIYYPVHLTPGYETAIKASQYINGVGLFILCFRELIFLL